MRNRSDSKTRRRVVYIAAALLYAGVGVHADSVEELTDAAARVQYAYYTEDARALEESLAVIDGLEVDANLGALKSYHLAYGHWRLAQVQAAVGNKRAAAQAVNACETHADAATASDARFAEAFGVAAVCDVAPASQGKAGCRSKPLRTALLLAPQSPRLLFMEALCARDSDVEDWRAVVTAFEAAPPRSGRAPDWGHAEALLALGQSYLTRGDSVAARDAVERALVIAPDYRAAQVMLEAAASRPR